MPGFSSTWWSSWIPTESTGSCVGVTTSRRFPLVPNGVYRSEVFPGLWLDAKALFDEDRRKLIRVLKRGLRTPEHAAFVAKLAAAGKGRKPR